MQATAPGYAKVRVRPAVPTHLSRASATVGTPRGELTSGWRQTSRKLVLTVTVPGNTVAEIHVPATESQDEKVKSHHRVDSLPAEDGYAVFGAGSGTHVFEVQPR